MKAVSVLGSRGTRRAVRILTLSLLLGATGSPLVAAEPQPGDTLNQENWQQAKSLLPEGMLPRFADGSYQAQIVSPPTTMTWGSAFTSASAANADKFEVDADGALVVEGTKTVPPFLYGTPFPRIDPTDPQAAAKVIYNFSYTLMQADDVDRSSVLHWVVPKEVQNQVEFRTQLLFQGARFSGPITNPDATLRKGIISGITPAASAVGAMFWSLVKIGVSVLMLVLAPRVVQPLSWPALLVALVLCIQVYWLALLWRGR